MIFVVEAIEEVRAAQAEAYVPPESRAKLKGTRELASETSQTAEPVLENDLKLFR